MVKHKCFPAIHTKVWFGKQQTSIFLRLALKNVHNKQELTDATAADANNSTFDMTVK